MFYKYAPISFGPKSTWDVLYCLDARNWLNNRFILYKIQLKKTSTEWNNIQINSKQTFEDLATQGKRPRKGWETLYPQIKKNCVKVFEGTFDDIFIPTVK